LKKKERVINELKEVTDILELLTNLLLGSLPTDIPTEVFFKNLQMTYIRQKNVGLKTMLESDETLKKFFNEDIMRNPSALPRLDDSVWPKHFLPIANSNGLRVTHASL